MSSKFITLLRKGRWHHLSFEKYGWAQWHLCGNILDGNTKGKKEGVSNPFWLSKQTRWGFFSNHHIMFRNQVNIIKQALKITGCQPLEAAPLCRDSRPSLISRPPTLPSLLLLCSNRLLCYRWSSMHYSTIPVVQNFLKAYHSGYPLPSRGLSEQF